MYMRSTTATVVVRCASLASRTLRMVTCSYASALFEPLALELSTRACGRVAVAAARIKMAAI